jgi:hypothetical protein
MAIQSIRTAGVATFNKYSKLLAGNPPFFPIVITGGTLASDETYYYRTFTSSGTFEVSLSSLTADVLIIGGGGPAGVNGGGGGGAGGVVFLSNQTLNGSYFATVGAGGAWQGTATDSSFGSLGTALKGGWGRSRDNPPTTTQTSVGSGGGGAGYTSGGAGNNQGTGTVGQGQNGGPGTSYELGGSAAGGGGGGFSEVGGSGASQLGGKGGNGTNAYSSWGIATNTGQNISGVRWYAGGGGGGVTIGGTAGAAGSGSVGVNTGGGGTNTSGNSGIVIVRYLRSLVGG